MAKKAKRALKSGKAFHLRLDPSQLEHNIQFGGGLWDDIKDFGKKAVNLIANDIVLVLILKKLSFLSTSIGF